MNPAQGRMDSELADGEQIDVRGDEEPAESEPVAKGPCCDDEEDYEE